MCEPRVVLSDIGGVLLTNGWDHGSRNLARQRFGLDEDFEERHRALAKCLDRAEITLDEYLDRVVFDRPRSFTRDEFIAFMQHESKPYPEMIQVLDEVVASRRYRVFALNNESRELNDYRIRTFELGKRFDAFLSSCYLGLAKPDETIYRRALEIVHRAPDECVFIDDRPENCDPARKLGMLTILHESAMETREALRDLGMQL